jgi:hypothetical protein
MIPEEWQTRIRTDWDLARAYGSTRKTFVTIWTARMRDELKLKRWGGSEEMTLRQEVEALVTDP